MSLEKSTPYRNAWYRDLLEKEAELKQYTDDKVAQAIELPEVTSEDNGDLLAADDGSWVKSDKLKTIMNADIEQVGKIPMVGAQGTWTLTDYPSNELPSVTSADNGKVAGVVNGNWDTMNIPNELPTVTGADDGKVLGVTSGAWDTMNIPNELPTVTGADDGKVLGVTNGAWGTMTPQNKGLIIFEIDPRYNTDRLLNGKRIPDVVSAILEGYDVALKKDIDLFRLIKEPTINTPVYSFVCFKEIDFNSIAVYYLYTSANSTEDNFTRSNTYRCVLNPSTSNKKLLGINNYNFEYVDYELPTVSASDNGSVLKVVNGQWAVGQVASSPIPISSSNSINAITVEGSLI